MKTYKFIALAAIAALTLTACGANSGSTELTTDDVHMHGEWISATDSDMTAMYGELSNHTDQEITLVSAETEIAGLVEIHETVVREDGTMVMREAEAGISIPADNHIILAPGGMHIMIMELKQPIHPGDSVPIKLTFSNGSFVNLEVTAKDFAGDQGEYDHQETGH